MPITYKDRVKVIKELASLLEKTEEVQRGYDFKRPGTNAVFTLRCQNFINEITRINLFNCVGLPTEVPTPPPYEFPTVNTGEVGSPNMFGTYRPFSQGSLWLSLMAMQSGKYLPYKIGLLSTIYRQMAGALDMTPVIDADTGLLWFCGQNTNHNFFVYDPIRKKFVHVVTDATIVLFGTPSYDSVNKQMIIPVQVGTAAKAMFIDTATYSYTLVTLAGSTTPQAAGIIDANTGKYYLPNATSKTYCIDLVTHAVTVITMPGTNNSTPILDTTNKRLFVPRVNFISVIDINPLSINYNTVIASLATTFSFAPVPPDFLPRGIFYNGNCYICSGTGLLIKIDSTLTLSTLICGAGAYQVFESGGNLYVSSTNSIQVVSPVSFTVTATHSVPGSGLFRAGSFDPARKLFIFPASNFIRIFDNSFTLIQSVPMTNGTAAGFPCYSEQTTKTYVSLSFVSPVSPPFNVPVYEIGDTKDFSLALTSATLFDCFNGDMVETNSVGYYDNKKISDECLSYLSNPTIPIPPPIVKNRISCAQIPYKYLLGELEDTVIKIKSIKMQVTSQEQFYESLKVMRLSIFGDAEEYEIKPDKFINPLMPNETVVDITFTEPFFIDKKSSIFTRLLPNSEILLNFEVEAWKVNFELFEKYFQFTK